MLPPFQTAARVVTAARRPNVRTLSKSVIMLPSEFGDSDPLHPFQIAEMQILVANMVFRMTIDHTSLYLHSPSTQDIGFNARCGGCLV